MAAFSAAQLQAARNYPAGTWLYSTTDPTAIALGIVAVTGFEKNGRSNVDDVPGPVTFVSGT